MNLDKNWKFIPVIKEKNVIAEILMDEIYWLIIQEAEKEGVENPVFPIHKDEMDTLNNTYLQIISTFESLPGVEIDPKERNIAFVYSDQVIFCDFEEFLLQYGE
jgi:hypothetical protein